MTLDYFLEQLNILQTRLLSMPEEEALSEAFHQEQEKLETLLKQLPTLTEEEQAHARQTMQVFAQHLNEKVAHLRARLQELSQTAQKTQKRARGIKAYTQAGSS